MEKIRVWHLDDDAFVIEKIGQALAAPVDAYRFTVESFLAVAPFRKRMDKAPGPDVVILDISLDGEEEDGKALVGRVRKRFPAAAILMCSGLSDFKTVAQCLREGADDFISKDSDEAELSLRIANAFRMARLKRGTTTTAPAAAEDKKPMVGATMSTLANRIPLLIGSAVSAIHVFGESGTGKEVVADLFAAALPPGTPFIRVNCGSIAPTLLESELFGHVKGAFTGAMADKKGLLESAHGGWVFLDEVATLSPSAQVALLRVLDNHTLRRVGSAEERAVKIRVISAANEDLQALAAAGRFRLDLWQRLCEAHVVLPPLRQRTREIPELIAHFCRVMPGGPYRIAPAAVDVLTHYGWRHGNVRELRNCLRAMTELSVDQLLTPLSIPERIWAELGKDAADDKESAGEKGGPTATASESTGEDPAAHAESDRIVLSWGGDEDDRPSFDALCDVLLLEVTRAEYRRHGRMSLRTLSKLIGMPRSTLSTRLKDLVFKKHVGLAELSHMVSVDNPGGKDA